MTQHEYINTQQLPSNTRLSLLLNLEFLRFNLISTKTIDHYYTMEKQLGHFLLIFLSTKEVVDQNKSTIILEQKLHFFIR